MKRSLLAVMTLTSFLGGCGRPSTQVEGADSQQVLLIGNKDEPADLDPHINTAGSTSRILGALFEGLVTFANDGKTLLPGVATTWEISGDGLTYSFHLRGDARWSNGESLGAEDFRASFLRVIDPRLGSEQAGYAFSIRGARDFQEGRSKDPATVGVRAPDPRTLIIDLEHPAPYLLKLLARDPFFPVYMPSLDAQGGRSQRGGPWTRPGALVSNGPFTLEEWRPNVFVRLKRNPHYWDAARVHLLEVRFYPTDDEAAEERAFRSGQLHITNGLPKSKVAAYALEHPEELHLLPILRTNFLTFNTSRAPFSDARVRRAFSLAINREMLVKAALGRLGAPANSFVRPGTGGFTPEKGFSYDPAEAATLLAAAGYPGGVGLPPVELSLNGNTGVALSVAEVLQQMWAKTLGVKAVVLPMEFKAYLSAIRERQFQVVMEGFTYLPDARELLEFAITGDPYNDSGGSSAPYDRAFEAADRAPDEASRMAAFGRMEALNAQACFYVPVYYSNKGFLMAPSVRGWRDNSINAIDWRELSLRP